MIYMNNILKKIGIFKFGEVRGWEFDFWDKDFDVRVLIFESGDES